MSRFSWIAGAMVTFGIVLVPVVLVAVPAPADVDPWENVQDAPQHVDHSALMEDPFSSGEDVTRACLECHEDASHEVMQTTHWTWQAPPVEVAWSDQPVSTGKANVFNNFCIGIQSNEQSCTRCHAGYGWEDDTFFETATEENVDCLVCHDQSGAYVKSTAGNPAEGVDLLVAAQSVGLPTRENCGSCHFNGGGGNGVKHGDLDESLYFPSENLDVHMGRLDFQCIDCHRTTDHLIGGRSISVSVDNANQIACTDCHSRHATHTDSRLNEHTDAVACQTCHIPAGARRDPTKMDWRWSDAGQDREEDPHEYLKIKGSFVYESKFIPQYTWYNGTITERYLMGAVFDPSEILVLNLPAGDINDPDAMIWPFKVHDADQPYDTEYNYLLQPNTVGEAGYWTTFDWDSAFERGADVTGIPFSGSFDFAETQMYWPITHMVAPANQALQCTDCHSEYGRMDWEALGYPGDPMTWGSRD